MMIKYVSKEITHERGGTRLKGEEGTLKTLSRRNVRRAKEKLVDTGNASVMSGVGQLPPPHDSKLARNGVLHCYTLLIPPSWPAGLIGYRTVNICRSRQK